MDFIRFYGIKYLRHTDKRTIVFSEFMYFATLQTL